MYLYSLQIKGDSKKKKNLYPEDRESVFFKTFVDIYETTRQHMPEGKY
jgi:hypothetical protein